MVGTLTKKLEKTSKKDGKRGNVVFCLASFSVWPWISYLGKNSQHIFEVIFFKRPLFKIFIVRFFT